MNFRALALTFTRRAKRTLDLESKSIEEKRNRDAAPSQEKNLDERCFTPASAQTLVRRQGTARSKVARALPRTANVSSVGSHTRTPRGFRGDAQPEHAKGSIGRSRRILLGAHLIDGRDAPDRTRWIPWYASSPSPAHKTRFTDTVVSHVRLDRAEYRGQTGRTRPLVPRIALAASLGFLAGERERAATPRATRAVRRARAPDARQTRGARSRPRRDAVEKRTRARVPTRDPAGV